MSDEMKSRALGVLRRAMLRRGLVNQSDNDVLLWAAERSDRELLHVRGFGPRALECVRALRPLSPWVPGELEHTMADFMALLPAMCSWRLASPQRDEGWHLALWVERGSTRTQSDFRGLSLVSVFRAAARSLERTHGG